MITDESSHCGPTFDAGGLHRLIVERAERWVQLARERIGPGVRCVIGLGNDDVDDLAAIFAQGSTLCPPDGLIDLDGFWFGAQLAEDAAALLNPGAAPTTLVPGRMVDRAARSRDRLGARRAGPETA